MKVGDLIYDTAARGYGIIVELYPSWTASDGQIHYWDFRILSGGKIFFADLGEVRQIDHEDQRG